jgi:hypothetical protein
MYPISQPNKCFNCLSIYLSLSLSVSIYPSLSLLFVYLYSSFTYGGEIISNMESVVAALFVRAKNMTTKTEVAADSKEEDDKKTSETSTPGATEENKSTEKKQ